MEVPLLSLDLPRSISLSSECTIENASGNEATDTQDESSRLLLTSRSSSEIANIKMARFASRELLSPWFPKIDPDNPKAQTFTVKRSQREILIYIALALAIFVFVVNLIALVLSRTKWKHQNGFGVLFYGDCNVSHRLNIILHLGINVLSTLLLGASNMCMQLLASPTRGEIDAAHERKRWLDIGTPSLRNLRSISTKRLSMWCILGLSSIPLHFFYNSIIIPTIPVNAFVWAMVTPGFLSGTRWNLPETFYHQNHWPGMVTDPSLEYHGKSGNYSFYDNALKDIQERVNSTTAFERLENGACFFQYRQLLGNHSDLLLVTTGKRVSKLTTDLLQIPSQYIPSNESIQLNSVVAYGEDNKGTWEVGWNFCGDVNGVQCIQPNLKPDGSGGNLTDWSIGGFLIDYCLSSQKSLHNSCRVEYSFILLTVVSVFNLLKVICIIYTARHFSKNKDTSILIFGDAISSFLEQEDPTTVNMSSITSKISLMRMEKSEASWGPALPSSWKIQKLRYFHAASWTQWLTFFLSFLIIIIVASIFLGNGIAALTYKLRSGKLSVILDRGFGSVDIVALLGILQGVSTASFYKNVFFANSWQLGVSFLYFTLNLIFSTILASAEWDKFVHNRKFLRVTSPRGLQRSSYFISMPARYGIPMLALFGLLHWTVSESIFVVHIERFYSDRNRAGEWISSGFSCSAIILSMALGVVIVTATIAFGAQKFPHGMPLAATCSAAISCACHPPKADTEPYLFPLQWGIVGSDREGRGHCAFTTAVDIREPIEGEIII